MCNEILKSGVDGSIAIVVTCCKDCPYVATSGCGKHHTCNHPSMQVKKPYAKDRIVEAHNISQTCVLVAK